MNACTVMSANKFTTCDPMVDTIEVVKDSVGLDSGICHAEVVSYTLKNAGKALTNSVNEWTSEVLGNFLYRKLFRLKENDNILC